MLSNDEVAAMLRPVAESFVNGWLGHWTKVARAPAIDSLTQMLVSAYRDGSADALRAVPASGEVKLNPVPLGCCRTELVNQNLTPPDDATLTRIIERDPEFVDKLNQYYVSEEEPEYGLDTFERDILFDLIAEHFIKREWPRLGDGGDAASFRESLLAKARAEGWKVADDIGVHDAG